MNEDFYIEFDFFIKKKNKNVKLIWNKDEGFTDNELIELFGLDDDETLRAQIEIVGAQLYGNIPQIYKEYFKNNYTLEDYYLLFSLYQSGDVRFNKEDLYTDIEISYNCKVRYKDIFYCFETDSTIYTYYKDDVTLLNDEKENTFRGEIVEEIERILALKDSKKIREQLLYEKINILEDKISGGFYYFYEPGSLFKYSYNPWDDISTYM